MTMRALRVIPGKADSAVLDEIDDPPASDGSVLVSTVAVGICGTDFEIVEGLYGWAPAGRDKLVIGHEAVGRVIEAPDDSGFSAGDIVVPIVRRPDPVPCRYCAAGEWDMCVNGRYTERGIKELDGYASERFRIGLSSSFPCPLNSIDLPYWSSRRVSWRRRGIISTGSAGDRAPGNPREC